jgi:D-glycero-D-manno-heptose 1,7-bisphosphate phosphatase
MSELTTPGDALSLDKSADIIEWFGETTRAVRPIVFVDRDGVINQHIESGYVLSQDDFRFIPDVIANLKRLTDGGRDIIVISNQSCINRGLLDPETLRTIMDDMVAAFEEAGVSCIAWLCCPHRPDENCSCRKPGAAMLERAAAKTGTQLPKCVVVGDSVSDLAAARRVGSDSFFVQRNNQWSLAPIVDRILEGGLC